MNEMKMQEVENLLQEVIEKVEVKEEKSDEVQLRIKVEKEESMEFTNSEVSTTSECNLKQEVSFHLQNVLEKIKCSVEKWQRKTNTRIKEEKGEDMEFTCTEKPGYLMKDVQQEVTLHLQNVLEEIPCTKENRLVAEIKLRIKEEKLETCSEQPEYLRNNLQQEVTFHLQNVLEKIEFTERSRHQHEIKPPIEGEKQDNLKLQDFKSQVLKEVLEKVESLEENFHQQEMKPQRKSRKRLILNRDALGRFIKHASGTSNSKIGRGIRPSELKKLTSSFGGVKLGRRYCSQNSPIAHRTRSKLYRKSKQFNRR